MEAAEASEAAELWWSLRRSGAVEVAEVVMNAQIHDPLTSLLASQGVAILDGGLATTLEANGFDTTGELWSARALVDEPGLLERVHGDFCVAGADCIATATYQATVPGLVRAGVREAEALALFARAVELARHASERAFAQLEGAGSPRACAKRRRSLVAASIGPFGAYLADGSEYRGDYRVGRRELVDFHRPRLRALIAARPDLLAFETLPSGIEAMALLELLDQELSRGPLPGAWISFQCRDGSSLADGTQLDEVVPALDRHPAILAIGVNCVPPRLVRELLRTLGALTGKPLVAYPNSGERWQDGDWRGETEDWIEEAPAWIELGGRLIGGCCRTGPEDVGRLRELLLAPGDRPPGALRRRGPPRT